MKLLLSVNKVDDEMVEMWRWIDTARGMQLLGVVHCDSFEGDIYSALYDENAPDPLEISLEVVK